jgi:uncharacterized protein YciI
MRVAYIYSMKRDADRVRAVVPQHVAYWNGLRIAEYLGGPFEDRSGGLITFEIGSIEEAERLIGADPFAREDVLESAFVKRWIVE